LLDKVTVFFIDRLMAFASRIEAKSARLENGFWLIEEGQRFRPNEAPEPFSELRLPTKLTTTGWSARRWPPPQRNLLFT
jgi:hypothetical protein